MKQAEKIDLYKLHKADYETPKKPILLEIQPALYLAIDGLGEPGGEAFQAKIGALYSVAYTIKMTRKFEGKGDYTVCKLEGQWWAEGNHGGDFSRIPKEKWCWKLLIRTPDFIKPKDLKRATETLEKKGKDPEFKNVALETLGEGKCVQMLHVGPYEREGETIAVMMKFAEAQGLEPHGLHHEIYLSDPRRVPPERLKTILRHPVRKRS